MSEDYPQHKPLNGGEIDTLYKLHFFGPQDDGGIPSKCGLIGLINRGMAVKDYDNRPPNRLTALGKQFAEGHPWKRPPTQSGASDE